MTWTARSAVRTTLCALLCCCLFRPSHAQWFAGRLADTTNRADYLLLTPSVYADIVEPLAAFRQGHQSLAVMTVLLDSVLSQFPRATPDSSIRAFVTRTLTSWQSPHPRFLLLAGTVNTIPSHWVASEFPPMFGEDSVLIDQWFVNERTESLLNGPPAMAVGRFPAWNRNELTAMVDKTMDYEQADARPWAARSVVVADSTDYQVFEPDGLALQKIAVDRWPDTVSVHVRENSPAHRSREEFRALWNEGCAILSFQGHISGPRFSHALYVTTWDVDSLAPGSPTPLCLFGGTQRFDVVDTVAIALALLRAPGYGAVCAIAPSGLMYASANAFFEQSLYRHLVVHPADAIGMAWVAALESSDSPVDRRRTLLGDPALVIKSGTITSVLNPEFGIPSGYVLNQNYPNPFNPVTTIRYGLPEHGRVRLTVYNSIGQQVATLYDGEQGAGYHEVRFDSSRVSSGIYFYRMYAGGIVQTKQLVVLR